LPGSASIKLIDFLLYNIWQANRGMLERVPKPIFRLVNVKYSTPKISPICTADQSLVFGNEKIYRAPAQREEKFNVDLIVRILYFSEFAFKPISRWQLDSMKPLKFPQFR